TLSFVVAVYAMLSNPVLAAPAPSVYPYLNVSVPPASAVGRYVKPSGQPLPVPTLPQKKLLEALLQPAGKAVKSDATNKLDAGLPSSVVNVTGTACLPVFWTAMI